jgi:phosphate transport system permease protein
MSEQPSNLQLRAPFTTSDFIRRKERREQIAKWFFGFMAAAMIIPLLLILAKVIITGLPSMTWEFFTENPRRGGTQGGIWPALVGTLYLIAISLFISAPVGILAAVYLNEYARDNWFTRLVNLAVVNLAGVPSVVHGLFGLGAFVYALGMGKSVMAASLTLAIMTLPVIIASTKEALSAVPMSFREACWNVGASRWQTIWRVVLPNSISGILTGVILQVSRTAGETAPVMLTGVATFKMIEDHGLFLYNLNEQCMALSMHLFYIRTQASNAPESLSYAIAATLLGVVLLVNATAIAFRAWLRSRKKW